MRRFKVLALLAVAAALLCAPAIALAQDAAPSPASTSATQIRVWLAIVIAVAWPVFTGIVNSLFAKYTPADVDAWAERNPHVAFIAGVFRRAGFEPVALLEDVKAWAKKDPPAPRFGAAAMGKRRGYVDVRVSSILGCIGVGLLACAIACGLLAPVAPDIASLEQCEAKVVEEHPGADFETIVVASLPRCAGQGAKLIVDVLDAIIASKDPAVAQYRPEALAAKNDPAKLAALRAKAGRP